MLSRARTVQLTKAHPFSFCKKSKGLPQQAWTGQRGSRQVKAPDLLDVRHYEGGRSSALRIGRLYPRRNPWYSFLEAESTPGHVVPSVAMEKVPSDTTARLVAQCLSHYATTSPLFFLQQHEIFLLIILFAMHSKAEGSSDNTFVTSKLMLSR